MERMKWDEYIERFWEFSSEEETFYLRNIDSLGTSQEVVELVENLNNPEDASWLIHKTMSAGYRYHADEICSVCVLGITDVLSGMVEHMHDVFSRDQLMEMAQYIEEPDLFKKMIEHSQDADMFTVATVMELCESVDSKMVEWLAMQASEPFSSEQLRTLYGCIDDSILKQLIQKSIHSGVRFSAEELETWAEETYFLDNTIEEISAHTDGVLSSNQLMAVGRNIGKIPESLLNHSWENGVRFTKDEILDLASDSVSIEAVIKMARISEVNFAEQELFDNRYSIDNITLEALIKSSIYDSIRFVPEHFYEWVLTGISDEVLLEIATHLTKNLEKEQINMIYGHVSEDTYRKIARASGYQVLDREMQQQPVMTKLSSAGEEEAGSSVADDVVRALGFFCGLLAGIFILVFGVIWELSKDPTGTKRHKKQSYGRKSYYHKNKSEISKIIKMIGRKTNSRVCDGNCATCPPHYGYRYGRWYYGHGHIEGCEFGGNKGDGSM